MPRIKEIGFQTNAPGPVQTRRLSGEDMAGGNLGVALATGAKSVTEFADVMAKRAEQDEVSDLHAKIAKAHADFTTGLQETIRTAKPGDKEVVSNFIKNFDDYMGGIGENVSTRAGREYFTQASAQLRAHFAETAFEGQSHLAGVKAREDAMTAVDQYSSSLINDPSSLKTVIGLHQKGLDLLVQKAGMSTEDATKLRFQQQTELYKSAIRGWIKVNPDVAKQKLDSGEFDSHINGDIKNQMFGEVKVQENANEVQKERAEKAAKKAVEAAREVTKNDFIARVEKNELEPQMVLDSNLDAAEKEHYIRLIKTTQSEKIKTDPAVFIDTLNRIHSPESDPRHLSNEDDLIPLVGKGITFENLQQFRGEMQGRKTEAGAIEAEMKKGVLDSAKGYLTKSNPLTGLRDPIGDEQYQRFLSWFLKEASEKRKNGKSAGDLYNPDSADYLGKGIRQFMRSQDQQMKDLIKMNTPGRSPQSESQPGTPTTPLSPPGAGSAGATKVDPRRPDESPADYLKRIGK